MPRMSRWLLSLAGAGAVVALDQWSKELALLQLDYARPLSLLPWLDLTLHYNSGAAFSLLSEAGGWQRWFLSAIAAVAGLAICIWLARLQAGEKLLAVGLSLILGGALGNLWDRLTLGHVVDFISLHYADWYFPAFNLADSAITAGAALLLLDTLLHALKSRRQ